MTTNTMAVTSPSCSGISRCSACTPTPHAMSASDVRIHARKVRSLARLNRGSGSDPWWYTLRGKRLRATPGFRGELEARVDGTTRRARVFPHRLSAWDRPGCPHPAGTVDPGRPRADQQQAPHVDRGRVQLCQRGAVQRLRVPADVPAHHHHGVRVTLG